MHEVRWKRSAEKALGRLPGDIQQRIRDAVGVLGDNPRPRGTEKLYGKLQGLYRIRVGIHYRVLYRIDDSDRVVTVMSVASRESSY